MLPDANQSACKLISMASIKSESVWRAAIRQNTDALFMTCTIQYKALSVCREGFNFGEYNMKLFTVDANYLSYLYGVDPQVLQNHRTNDRRFGRVCVIDQQNYKGEKCVFAVPIKGDIDPNKADERYCVMISTNKVGGNFASGFLVNKALIVDMSLVHRVMNDNGQFRQIAIDITHKQDELKAKLDKFLRASEKGEYVKYGTDLERQQYCYKARNTLLNAGIKEEEIYQLSFSALLLKAEEVSSHQSSEDKIQSLPNEKVQKEEQDAKKAETNTLHIDVKLSEDDRIAQILIMCGKKIDQEILTEKKGQEGKQVKQVEQVKVVEKQIFPITQKKNSGKGR